MPKIIFVFILLAVSVMAPAQDMKKFNLYRPAENAAAAIQEAVTKAAKEKKHVFIQVGGNWCIWCARFNDFVKKDPEIDSLVKASFVVYHLNYSPENRNLPLLAKYSFPQRFGFPVFLILDGTGKLIHTQNSGYLEEGKGYSKEKVTGFFKDWTKEALNPAKYKKDE